LPRRFFSFGWHNYLIAVPQFIFRLARLLDCCAAIYIFGWSNSPIAAPHQNPATSCRLSCAVAPLLLLYLTASPLRLLYFLWLWLGCSSAHVSCCHHNILLRHTLAVALQ
jgi:hypothetical protein